MILDERTLRVQLVGKGFSPEFITETINKFQNAHSGEVLYFAVPLANTDILETLLQRSGVSYSIKQSRNIIRYCKL